MKSSAAQFIAALAAASLLSAAEILGTLAWLAPPGYADPGQTLHVLLAGGLFVALAVALVGRKARLLGRRYDQLQGKTDEYQAALKALGSLPIGAIGLYVALQALFMVAVFQVKDWFPLREGVAVEAFCEVLALGMLNGGFVFIVADRLVVNTLSAQRLREYPAGLREGRQKTKVQVIPLFMSAMSMLFAFALPLLLQSIGSADGAKADLVGSYAKGGAAALLFLVILFVLIRIWARTTARLYRGIVDQLDQIASADKDLTGRIFVGSIDELGTIAGLTNQFCQTLESNIAELKAIQGRLDATGGALQDTSERSSQAVRKLVAEIMAIDDRNRRQSDSIVESSAAVGQISRNIESLDEMILQQSASVTEASASVEQMVGNINAINGSIVKMVEQFDRLEKEATAGAEVQKSAVERITGIEQKSKALEEANRIIAVIASQTNLLAMNAAIEAAHAGEAGLGFSVVADEIRLLAETASKETKVIKKVLQEVQSAIGGLVEATKRNDQSFTQVVDRIRTTDDLIREVKLAVDEQQEGAAQILEALRAMNEVTQQVRSGSLEMKQGSASIEHEMASLQDAAREFLASVQEMTAGTQVISDSSDQVYGAARDTRGAIAAMGGIIGAFKTGAASG